MPLLLLYITVAALLLMLFQVTVTRRYSTAGRAGGWEEGERAAYGGSVGDDGPSQSLYFKSSELSIKWLERVTTRELL